MCVPFDYGSTEGGQVGFVQVPRRGIDIEAMAQRLGSAVNSKVLRRCDRLQVPGVLALNTAHKLGRQGAGQERILTERFLPPAPAGIAEYVDVGGPESQPE